MAEESARILLVDDEQAVQTLLTYPLRRDGYEVIAAGDGHEWVRILDTIEAQPPEARFAGGTKYSLQGRTLALFTLGGHRRHRRASDHDIEADQRLALQVTH